MAYQPARREVALIDHTTLVQDSAGTGRPIVLIHALSMDSSFWLHGVFQALAATNDENGVPRRVIAYDLRGHGLAVDAPPTKSIEQLAEDLRALCLAENLRHVDVAGISYGGAVAQQFAISCADLLHSAIFLGTLPKGAPAFEDRAKIAETEGMDVLIGPTLERWFLPESLQKNIAGVQFAKKKLEETRTGNWAAAWRALGKLDVLDKLSTIQAPVLCLASTQDTSTPPSFLKKIQSAVGPNADYVEVNAGMHFFPLEDPSSTARSMITFLSKV